MDPRRRKRSPFIHWLFLLGYQVRSVSAPVPAPPISVISLTGPGSRHRDRTIIEKNPARYQATSWFPGSKTLKNLLFLLGGASETHGMQPRATPPPWTRRRRLRLVFWRSVIKLTLVPSFFPRSSPRIRSNKFKRFYQRLHAESIER